MRILRILTRKELNSYFLSPFGWVVLAFVAVVYWIFTFSFSRASLRIERKLGLGER